jgi:anti-sigma regulatory factor (Ser/Thr protein kinase)
MRTGAPTGYAGYFHEAALYSSDEELLDLVVPFLMGGVEANEPTLVSLDDRSTAVIEAEIGDTPGITFLPNASQYDRPALTLKRYRNVLEGYVADGVAQVRAIGSVPHPGVGAPWDSWARYEAAANRALADLPLWGVCVYDTRTTPGYVLDDVERLHSHLATPDGRHTLNTRFVSPEAVMADRPPPAPDPLEAQPPAVMLIDPTQSAARQAIRSVSTYSEVDGRTVDDLLIGVSEAVSNGVMYGRPPVVVRAWTSPDRVVVTVTDQGPGPSDPLVGLTPVPNQMLGGLGLWIAHQLCADTALVTSDDGFTVRLTARAAR